ncbi:MAG: cyclase family protein [Candidatus Obscuribacterales bacterium]|nr:cyclase family protein [Candidatus Obscuribacterales bacterium]
MTRLIDLTRPIKVVDKKSFPQQLMPLYRIISPEIEHIDHAQGAQIMQSLFSCPQDHLPDGEGWAEDNISLSSHLGTHVDAPWHYGSRCGDAPAKTIDQIKLEDLYCDGVVLDFSSKKNSGEAITVACLEGELKRINYKIKEGDAVLIRTGHDEYELNDPKRYNYPGMIGESAKWLACQGARVGGTDATGWDRPFPVMIADYLRTKNKEHIWDAHFAHREQEFYVVQQLTNLHLLPACGFKVAFFPLNIVGASAAPARVVAFIE